ncbi:MAG: oligosaccharide flippase family protein, partial [Odoribacter sp.]
MVKLWDFLCSFSKKLQQSDIIRVFSLTALSTLVKMLTGFISVKVVAIVIGPSGIALLGQLNNFSSIIMNIASLGINQGVTKFVSEHKEEDSIKIYISTAFRFVILGSLGCGIILILFHRFWSRVIMLSEAYDYVFIIFGFTVCLYAINNLFLSILNGYKAFK